MYTKLKELKAQRESILTQQREMLDKADAEKRELTADENTAYEAMDVDFTKLDDEIRNLETTIQDHEKRRIDNAKRAEESKKSPQFKGLEHHATAPVNGERKDQQDHHMRVYNKYLHLGTAQMTFDERRALQADKDIAGGFLVAPEKFTTELIKAIDDLVYMRQICRVFPVIKAESLGAPALANDPADADWTSELKVGGEDSTMDFDKRDLHPHPLAKYIKISKTLLDISLLPVDQLVRDRLAYKFAITMEKAFMSGTGVNRPLGVFTASASGISTARDVSTDNTATQIKADNLINCSYTLKEQYRRSARWIFHRDAVKMIRKLKTGEGDYLWQSGIAQDRPASIVDHPYLVSEYAPNTFTTGLYVGILGDFSNYWIVDMMSLSIQVLTELFAMTNQNAYVGRLATDGMPVLEEAFVRVKLG